MACGLILHTRRQDPAIDPRAAPARCWILLDWTHQARGQQPMNAGAAFEQDVADLIKAEKRPMPLVAGQQGDDPGAALVDTTLDRVH
jgi:hypothetical protein